MNKLCFTQQKIDDYNNKSMFYFLIGFVLNTNQLNSNNIFHTR